MYTFKLDSWRRCGIRGLQGYLSEKAPSVARMRSQLVPGLEIMGARMNLRGSFRAEQEEAVLWDYMQV